MNQTRTNQPFQYRIFWLIALALAACSPAPSARYALGAELLREDFSDPLAWERYVDPARGTNFRIEDGVYRARIEDGLMWALNTQQHTDVVIEVDATPITDARDNAYGVMCRASPSNSGDGYYFFISSDGHYTIRVGAMRELFDLIPWTQTNAVRQDRGINEIRIACIGDWLALYVNDQFVAETRDDRYRGGLVGLTAAIPEGVVEAEFDNLVVWAASR